MRSAIHGTPPLPPRRVNVRSTESENEPMLTPPGSPMDIDSSSPPKPQNPLISVFDWDDTLCPSSWLYREGLLGWYGLVDEPGKGGQQRSPENQHHDHPKKRALTQEDKKLLRQFEEHVLALLHTARQFGRVFIVTAAKLAWLRNTAECFFPNVLQVLSKSETVHVISAREFYAGQMQRVRHSHTHTEGTPFAWKSVTFEAVCAHLRVEEVQRRHSGAHNGQSFNGVRVNFVSVGDSSCERDACQILGMKAPATLHSKTIKLLDQPSLLELNEQVKMTRALYEQVFQYYGTLDLHVVRTRAQTLQIVEINRPARGTVIHSHAGSTRSTIAAQHASHCR